MKNMTLKNIADAVNGTLHTEGMPSRVSADAADRKSVV